jgi:hypothetical protein
MSTPIDQVIASANLYQDVELATAISALKNAGQVTSFIQSQQSKVYNDIVKQKEDTFSKLYGDLDRAGHVQESVLMYGKRTKQLASVQDQIYDNQKNSADAIIDDHSLASRKTEMNEWTVNNKKDTLFVYSSLFVMLSGLLLLTGLLRMGMISTSLWVGMGVCLIAVFVLILVNRSHYTNVLRNKRYWNKQIFEGKYGKIPIPLCPETVDSIYTGVNSLEQDVRSGISSGLIDAAKSVESGSKWVTAHAQEYAAQAAPATTQNAANTASK